MDKPKSYPDDRYARRRPTLRPYLVVQFNFGDGGVPRIPYEPLKEPKERHVDPKLWADLLKISPGLGLRPLFRALEPREFEEIIKKAESDDRNGYRGNHPDFFEFFEITAPTRADLCGLAGRLNADRGVRYAYVERPGPPPAVDYQNEPGYTGNNPPFNWRQWHHYPAPQAPANPFGGIDSVAAWKDFNLDGTGVTFYDLELGWLLDHEDLLLPPTSVVPGEVNDPWVSSQTHGAAVLGILSAKDSTGPSGRVGGVGIAPAATPRLVSPVDPASPVLLNTVLALQRLVKLANPGDIVVIEQQMYEPEPSTSWRLGPLELALADYAEIQLLTAKGVIVIEAAGNGDEWSEHIDLDTWPEGSSAPPLNPASPGFRNSRAVIVSAAAIPAAAGSEFDVLPYWTLGRRVDCFAWGRAVYTCWYDGWSRSLYSVCNDTSAATAIVAGAAILMQQQARNKGALLSVDRMRALLTGAGNTLAPPGFTNKIGVMPNLSVILPQIP